jgi:glyoxylate reductase
MAAPKVLVTRRLPDGGVDPLVQAGFEIIGPRENDEPYGHSELLQFAESVDAMVCLLTDRIDESILTVGAEHSLQLVANVAVGYDNIDWRAARRLGVAVANTPGVLDETTADAAFLLILAACRLMSEAEADLRAGRWLGWGVTQYLGVDVHGATLGIIGFGRIGRAVARRASGFGMQVIHHSRHDTGEAGYCADLDELCRTADIISVHTPGGPETMHLIDKRRLALMKPSAVVVNTARGPVVDEVALAEALHSGAIFAAGLDVFEREPEVHPRLLTAPRTVLLPHIGSASQATRRNMALAATNAVATLLRGGTPDNLIP